MGSRKPPIFIIGSHRSGTTLLRYMLSSHPNIFIPPESDFFPRFFGKDPTKPITQEQVGQILDLIFDKYRFVRLWQSDRLTPGDFNYNHGVITPKEFLDQLYSEYAEQYSAERWGDKTPIYSAYIPLLDEIFPDAQFIHLIRDGRDVVVSMLEKWQRKKLHMDIYFASKKWTERTQKAIEDGNKLGIQRYIEVRYESLVTQPEQNLQWICKFLQEEYFPEMAAPQELAKDHIQAGSFHESVLKAPSDSRIGRWRAELDAVNLRIFNDIGGELLCDLGYPQENKPVNLIEYNVKKAFLSLKYIVFQGGRFILQKAGLFPPV